MKTILILATFALASCTVTTAPDGTTTKSADAATITAAAQLVLDAYKVIKVNADK